MAVAAPGTQETRPAAVCLDTQHVRGVMSAQRNKTDKADALGIAHLMRTGWFPPGLYPSRKAATGRSFF